MANNKKKTITAAAAAVAKTKTSLTKNNNNNNIVKLISINVTRYFTFEIYSRIVERRNFIGNMHVDFKPAVCQ